MNDLTNTAVVVLAAGLSQRFGADDKLLASLDGMPLAAYCADRLASLAFAHRIAVCRDDPELISIFADRGFTVVINPDSTRGQASSLALAIAAAADAGAGAVLVCLADMPRVGPQHLLALLDALGDSPSGIVASIPAHGARPRPPAAFRSQHFTTLIQLVGDQGARQLLSNATLVVARDGELADFDVPSDFRTSA